MQFKQIAGQQALKSKLTAMAVSGRVPHAQLVLGQSGAGNLPVALAFAAYLLCKNPLPEDSCGECDACRKMQSFTHPDLHFSFPFPSSSGDTCVDLYPQWRKALQTDPYLSYESWMRLLNAENKQGNIPILECRAIIRNLSMKAYESKYKILLLWLPEFLGKEGNVLLKFLEEPPPDTLFLLVCSQPDKLLSTIVSRTQLLRVPPIDEEELTSYLAQQLEITREEAARFSMMSGGDLIKARELASNSESPYMEPFRQWMLYCYKKNMLLSAKWIEELSGKGREYIKGLLLYGIEIMRAIAVMEHLGERNGLNEHEKEFVTKLGKLMSTKKIFGIFDVLDAAIYEVERNGNVKMIFTDLSFKISKLF
jgi:DNA polymerase III subunit delta'